MTPQRAQGAQSLSHMSSNLISQDGAVFSPQRLDAASSLATLFSDNITKANNLVQSPSATINNRSRHKTRRGSAINAYATPTYVLTHEDDLLQQNQGISAFPLPSFVAQTPAYLNNAFTNNMNTMETETNNSGHKTKKAKQKKKRARNNSTSSMAAHGSHVKSNKKQKVPKTKTEKGSSRKLKALGLLCARFIIMHYKDVPDSTEIKLSNLSEEMGIERRRMYDCLNILESIKLVRKLRKDIYVWSGFSTIGETLLEIKSHADIHGIFDPAPSISQGSQGGKSKSLAVLAHQFISMFVTDACERKHVTLDEGKIFFFFLKIKSERQ